MKVLAILVLSCCSLTGLLQAGASDQANDTQGNLGLNNQTSLNKTKAYGQALAFYETALSLEPNATDILTNKGLLLIQLQRYDEAIGVFDKILAIDPQNVDALYNKGVALEKLGTTEEARKYYNIVNEIDPDYEPELVNRVSESLDIVESEPSIIGSIENQTIANDN